MFSGDQSAEPIAELTQNAKSSLKSYTPVQLFYLMRLSWLQRQRRETINLLDSSDWRIRLLHKALYSTFQDCVREGVGEEAKTLLGQKAHSN